MLLQKVTKRQNYILSQLQVLSAQKISDLRRLLESLFDNISTATLNRDLKNLIDLGLVVREGKGKATTYKLSIQYNIVRSVDLQEYFPIKSHWN